MTDDEMDKQLPSIDGYCYPFEYPRGVAAGHLTGIALGIPAFVIGYRHIVPPGQQLIQQWISMFGIWQAALVILLLTGTTVKLQTELHEWTHYVIRCLHGREPEFDNMSLLTRGNPNVQIPGQWATRGENVIVLLAPLVVVDAIALLLIVWNPSPVVTAVAALGFLINTSSAGNDVLGAYDDYRYPEGTNIYYPVEGSRKGYVYKPKE